MSKTVDQRVVSMQFDNSNFEKNVSITMNTLDKFKTSLNLDGATKGLENVEKAANKMDFSKCEFAATQAGFHISDVFEKVTRYLEGDLARVITDTAYKFKRLVDDFTVVPMSTGFNEYELKMGSVQTIMSSTGESLEKVNEYLEELNKYSDDTIYSFQDMTSNIGKFTNAGVKLEDAVMAIKGVSNEAARSGANANEASRAMYNFAQALSAGYVKLIDWKSIENANMATVEFKNQLLETAEAMGTVEKTEDGMYRVLTTNASGSVMDSVIDATHNFNDSLEYQWMTSEVLVETLKDYADVSTEIGKASSEAATKVKTFSMMMDTLKEAAQSGWAQTWEIVFGDFEKSSELWTKMSTVIGDIIGKSSSARNELLKSWSEDGGRSALIDSLSNAFSGLSSIVNAVKESFTEVFPPITAQTLLNISNSIKELTSHIGVAGKDAENLKIIYKGLFSIFDIGGKIVSSFIKAIMPLFTKTSYDDAKSGLLGFTAEIFKHLITLDEWITKTKIFDNIFGRMVYVITNAMTIIGNAFSIFKQTVSDVFNFVVPIVKALIDSFTYYLGFPALNVLISLLQGLKNRMADIIGIAREFKSSTLIAFDTKESNESINSISTALEKVSNVLSKLKSIATKTAGKIGEIIRNLLLNIANAFKNADYNGILDLINEGLFGGLILAITGFVKNGMKGPTNELTGIFGTIKNFIGMFTGQIGAFGQIANNINGVLSGLKGVLESYQKDIQANTLLKIASAIAILTMSLILLSGIDSNVLSQSITAMGALFAELIIATDKLNKIDGKFFKSNIGGTILSLSISILILTSALKTISNLSLEGLTKGIIVIYAIMAGLVFAFDYLRANEKKVISGSAAMITMSISVKILSSTLKALSKLSWEELGKGIAGLTGVVAILVTAMKLLETNDKTIIKGSTSMISIGIASRIMASSVTALSKLSWEELAKGLLGIGVVLLALDAFVRETSGSSKMISIGIGMTILSASMLIFSKSVKSLSSLSWEELGKGIVGLAGILSVLTIAVNLLPKDLLGKSIGLLIASAAVAALGSAFSNFANLSNEQIKNGLISMGGGLVVLAAGLRLMSGTIGGATAMMIASLALAVLVPPLILLSMMSLKEIAVGLIAIAGAFAVLGVAGAILGPLVPSILGLSAALALVGISILAIGVGITALGVGIASIGTAIITLSTLGSVASKAAAVLKVFLLEALISIIDKTIKAIGDGIVLLIEVFNESIPLLCETITNISLALIDTINQVLEPLIDCVLKALVHLLEKLAEYTPSIVHAGMVIIEGLIRGIADNIGGIIEQAVRLVAEFIKGIASQIALIIQAGFDLVVKFIYGLADAIDKNSSILGDAIGTLIVSIINGAVAFLQSLAPKIFDAGVDLIDTLIEGIKYVGSTIGETMLDFIKSALRKINSILGDFLDFGKDLIGKVKKGISDTADTIKDAIFKPISDALGKIRDKIGDFKQAGIDIMNGLKQGIESVKDAVINSVKNVADNVVDGFKNMLGIHSPSRVFDQFGRYIDLGLINGINYGSSGVSNSIEDLANSAVSGMGDALSQIKDTYDDTNIDVGVSVRPVVVDSNLVNVDTSTKSTRTEDVYSNLYFNGDKDLIAALDADKSRNLAIINHATFDGDFMSIESLRRAIEDLDESVSSLDESIGTMSSGSVTNNFEINGVGNPRDVADEVSRILQQQIERRDAAWA